MLSAKYISLLMIMAVPVALAAPKPHLLTFGKWISVKWFAGLDESTPIEMKVRPLFVDGKLKEFTIGLPHEVTETLFVVRRAFRVNDTLPDEKSSSPRWQWGRGGWILVDRTTGRVSLISLADFDAYYSVAAWYRDYVAYCGVSDDGSKVYAIVSQLRRRKPTLKKSFPGPVASDKPDSLCPSPVWQRRPARVTFELGDGQKTTYAIRGRFADAVPDEAPDRGEDEGAN